MSERKDVDVKSKGGTIGCGGGILDSLIVEVRF